MFTGIIKDIGEIVSFVDGNSDICVEIKTNLSLKNTNIGDSICCSGICLTVIEINKNIFKAELSKETINVTTASDWKVGKKINIELSLCIGEQLGGHMVSGHVDGIATLINKKAIKGSYKLDFKVKNNIIKYIVSKGSITLDGVSLTINKTDNSFFSVNIISYTYKETTLGALNINDKVNIEVDNIARYAIKFAEIYMKRVINEK